MNTPTLEEVKQALGGIIESYGYKKAAYWPTDSEVPECNPLGLTEGQHVDRTTAAKSLLAGATITLDLGYNGRISIDGRAIPMVALVRGVLTVLPPWRPGIQD